MSHTVARAGIVAVSVAHFSPCRTWEILPQSIVMMHGVPCRNMEPTCPTTYVSSLSGLYASDPHLSIVKQWART